VTAFNLTDWYGNTIYMPITASATLIFSVISIIKAAAELNIIRVHVQDVNNCEMGKK